MPTLVQTWIKKNDGMYSRGRVSRLSNDRESLVYGTYKPDEATTGVLPGVARTDFNSPSVTGSVTLSTPNVTYENLNFYGDIVVAAANIVFKNCWFWGGVGHPTSNRGCVTAYGNGNHNGLELHDCTITARSPSYYRDGIVGNTFKLYRCHIYNTNDGIGAFSPAVGNDNCNVEVYGCYVHDLVWWRQDPAHSDGTHNDCIQYQGGNHFIAKGNRLEAYSVTAEGSTETNKRPAPNGKNYAGSALIVNQNPFSGTSPTVARWASGVVIEDNWFNGGYAQLQLVRGNYNNPLSVTLGTNRYGRDAYENYAPNSDKRWICLVPNGGTINATNLYTHQIWEDNGALLTAGRATGIRTV